MQDSGDNRSLYNWLLRGNSVKPLVSLTGRTLLESSRRFVLDISFVRQTAAASNDDHQE